MYIFYHFDEVSAIRWSKMMTFSITSSQIFFANLLFLPETNEKPVTNLLFTPLIFYGSDVLKINVLYGLSTKVGTAATYLVH